MRTLLSTKEVASLMNVTETTIKRWTASEKLPCVKTPGGHRKFIMKDVQAFAEKYAYPVTGKLPPVMKSEDQEILDFSIQTLNYSRISGLVLREALHGERESLLELLSYCSRNHIPMAVISDAVIRPAMVKIGDLWMDGKLEINQEHLASQTLTEAIVRLRSEIARKSPNGYTAVCACAEGDYHEIGLRLLCCVLEAEGWSIQYLGANTPFETLGSFIRSGRPDLLCLSYTLAPAEGDFIGKMRELGTTTRSSGTVFLAGGYFSGSSSPREIGCDHIAASAEDAVAFLKNAFQLKPGPKSTVSPNT